MFDVPDLKSEYDTENAVYERLRNTWISTYGNNFAIDQSYGSVEIKKWSEGHRQYHGQIKKDSDNIWHGRVVTIFNYSFGAITDAFYKNGKEHGPYLHIHAYGSEYRILMYEEGICKSGIVFYRRKRLNQQNYSSEKIKDEND